MEVALAEVQLADTLIRKDKAPWVRDRLGNAEPFVAAGNPLGKFAQLSEARDEAGTGGNRGRGPDAEVRIEQLPFEEYQVPPLEVYSSTIVAQVMVGGAQDVLRHDQEGIIPEGLSDGKGTLAGR